MNTTMPYIKLQRHQTILVQTKNHLGSSIKKLDQLKQAVMEVENDANIHPDKLASDTLQALKYWCDLRGGDIEALRQSALNELLQTEREMTRLVNER